MICCKFISYIVVQVGFSEDIIFSTFTLIHVFIKKYEKKRKYVWI